MATFTGCSPFYVLRAGYEEARILLNRQPIAYLVELSSTEDDVREKLSLVMEAHDFARGMGLKPGRSFTTYSRVNRSPLVWMITASRKDSFQLHTWWYPIVGSVPYKGFFNKSDAQRVARSLELQGYETRLGGADAFSTLGWFNDPLLSTTLTREESRLVNTVLHEMLHTTLWLRGHVDFNESLANYVGYQGAIDFFKSKAMGCEGRKECDPHWLALYERSLQLKEMEFEISEVVANLYSNLRLVYQKNLPFPDVLEERERIFNSTTEGIRNKYPDLAILQEVNNAEIMKLRIYTSRLELFDELYHILGGDWPAFLEIMLRIKERSEREKRPPFEILEGKVQELRLKSA